jgi:hypothetical protein
MELLFAEEGWPDGVWYYEDMGFKHRPFMSPRMYREIDTNCCLFIYTPVDKQQDP